MTNVVASAAFKVRMSFYNLYTFKNLIKNALKKLSVIDTGLYEGWLTNYKNYSLKTVFLYQIS